MSSERKDLFGGIEAGGTKFICAIGHGPGEILRDTRFATTTPEETIQHAVDFFLKVQDEYGKIARLGVASFGPVDLSPKSRTFGYITSTPKPGWRNTNLLGRLTQRLGTPAVMDTDVNGAAFAELLWGAGVGLENLLYLTVGTGIGGGVIVNKKPVHGVVHPEVGHILLPHDRVEDPFQGFCPYHKDCLEGLAAGPAIERRWGKPGHELPEDHPAWALEAKYLGMALANMVLAYSPERIIMGGGVMAQSQLFPLIREATIRYLGGYVDSPAILENIDRYIVPPSLGARAGVLGALALAQFSDV